MPTLTPSHQGVGIWIRAFSTFLGIRGLFVAQLPTSSRAGLPRGYRASEIRIGGIFHVSCILASCTEGRMGVGETELSAVDPPETRLRRKCPLLGQGLAGFPSAPGCTSAGKPGWRLTRHVKQLAHEGTRRHKESRGVVSRWRPRHRPGCQATDSPPSSRRKRRQEDTVHRTRTRSRQLVADMVIGAWRRCLVTLSHPACSKGSSRDGCIETGHVEIP